MSANDILILDGSLTETKKQRAPELTDADFFEIFAAEQMMKDLEPSDDEIENGLVDGSLDGGIDGLYFLVNRDFVTDDTVIDPSVVTTANLIFLQATTSPSFEENRLNKLLQLTEDLLNFGVTEEQLKNVYNRGLQAAIKRFKEKYKQFAHVPHDFAISYFYVSKGDTKTINTPLEKKKERIVGKAREIFSKATCTFTFIGAAQLVELIQQRPMKTYPIRLAEQPITPRNQEAYVCLVTLRDYYQFIVDENKQIRNQLFESNVRDWQGKVKVNEQIRKSLEDVADGDDFWWLINGITIIAARAFTSGGQILNIDDPQIVNGLQTSRSIFNYVNTHDNPKDERKVLIRIISLKQAESRDHIIKATNSQTEVPDIRLHATEKIQRDIENHLRQYGLFYDRRKNHYKNEGKPISKIIEPLYLAQAVISIVLQRPNDARARPSTVIISSYDEVFTPDYPIQVYANCALLAKKVDAFLRNPILGVERKNRVNLIWYVVMDYSRALTGKTKPNVVDVANIVIPTNDNLLSACYARVNDAYLALDGTDTISKGPELAEKLGVVLGKAISIKTGDAK